MKIAYLIIAHNEFEVLSRLVRCLDDERNDIYVHIDKKVSEVPCIQTVRSELIFLKERIDVRWGDVSQIECEYHLFEKAYSHGGYSRYVLLSGVHLPLKTQDYIHKWFEDRSFFELLAPVPNSGYQTNQKMRRYNICTRWFANSVMAQRIWRICMETQRILGITRNHQKLYKISSNWVCLTENGIKCVLDNRREIMKEFRYSFCGDEFFVRTILERCNFTSRIQESSSILYCDFKNSSTPKTLTMDDWPSLISSGCLFARKFSSSEENVMDAVLKELGQ